MADPTRLELATSAVTGQRSNQLSYESTYLLLYIIFPNFTTSKIAKSLDLALLTLSC